VNEKWTFILFFQEIDERKDSEVGDKKAFLACFDDLSLT
jgi:hypothetical protein